MKKILAVFAFCIFATTMSFGQFANFNRDNFNKIKKSTLLVILDDNDSNVYNAAIQKAIKQAWKFTPYKFIKLSEVGNYYADLANSFLINNIMNENNDNDNKLIVSNKITKSGFVNYAFNGAYALLPSFYDSRASFEELAQKSPDMYYAVMLTAVQFLEQCFEKSDEILKTSPNVADTSLMKLYRKNRLDVMKKQLVVEQDNMSMPLADAKKIYPHGLKVIDAMDILKTITTAPDGVVYYIQANYNNFSYKYFVDAKTGKILYYIRDVFHHTLEANDFKDLETGKMPEVIRQTY